MQSLKTFSLYEYQQLIEKSVVLEKDKHGLKVMQTSDGLIVKLFRVKRLFSSALLKSYAARFVENAGKLKKLGFNTVDIVDVLYCKSIKRTLVFYQPLPGSTLRTVLQSQKDNDELIVSFVRLLAQLHERGVFFRSFHFNNVIVANSMETLGLIDISDMKIWPTRLPAFMRMRNFRHLLRYSVDQESIKKFGVNKFMDIYFREALLPESRKRRFIDCFEEVLATEGQA